MEQESFIDPTIREEMIPSDGSALLDGRIFSHKKNF
jgi:hypothetical protein